MRFRCSSIVGVTFLSLLLSGCRDSASDFPGETTYTVEETELLPLPEGSYGAPTAINAGGVIVGWTQNNARDRGRRAARWTDGEYESIHQPPWNTSSAEDINDRNDIVGYYYRFVPSGGPTPDDRPTAVLIRSGTPIDIGFWNYPLSYDGTVSSLAFAINERGDVAGFSHDASGETILERRLQAVVWHTGDDRDRWTFVGDADTLNTTVATDINDQLVTVGRRLDHRDISNRRPSDEQVVFYSFTFGAGELTLGDGLCLASGATQYVGDRIAINNNNVVVGSDDREGRCQAVRFRPGQSPVPLGGTSESERSHAFDINDQDIIVGVNARQPVFWTPDGDMIELPTLGHEWGEAKGINEANEIVGFVSTGGYDPQPVVWRLGVEYSLQRDEVVLPPGDEPRGR